MIIGIYALYWEGQDLIYIGQSQNIEARYKEHLTKLINSKHTNYKVQDAFNRYGSPKLTIVERCPLEDLNTLEIYWTEEFDSIDNGLNIVEAGNVGWGVNSNASKYTKWQVLKVFSLLYKQKLSNNEISSKCKVPSYLVSDILNGKSHLWLKVEYPQEYQKLIANRGILAPRLDRVLSVLSPTGAVYKVTKAADLLDIMQLPCLPSYVRSVNKLLASTRKSYKGYKILA